MQKKDSFLFSITGIQSIDDDKDRIELTVPGQYIRKDGHTILKYREFVGNDRDEYTDTTIDVLENTSVTVTKKGIDSSIMILEKGKRHQCQYITPVGTIIMGVETIALINRLADEGGVLKVKYQVDFFSGYMTDNILEVKVKRLEE